METFSDLLEYLELDALDASLIGAMLSAPTKYYRSFKIPKKKGGMRLIQSPYPSLDSIQRVILRKALSQETAHSCSFAYVKRKCALGHASTHLGSKEVLILDIENFFGNITRQMVFETFCAQGLPEKISHFCSIICCLNGSIPQGACTSPILSNLIFTRFDERFFRLAESLELNYSRYADDLAFSGRKVPRNLPHTIQKILKEKNFRLNEEKTQLKLEGAKKIITGISISSGVIKAPKAFKRALRAQIYELEQNINNLSKMRCFDPLIYERTLGRINYLLQIEPTNTYAITKKKQLSEHHQNFLKLADGHASILEMNL